MPLRDCPFRTSETITTPGPVLPILITNPQNGFEWQTYGLLDTGARSTTIPDFVAKKIGLDIRAGKRETGFGASGDLTLYLHKCKIDIFHVDSTGFTDDTVVVHTIDSDEIAVLEGLRFVLLGVDDFLSQFHLQVSYPARSFSVRQNLV
jgi:hypothetical protein